MRLFTTLRELSGKRVEILEFNRGKTTVSDVLTELVKRHGKEFKEYLLNEQELVRGHLQLLVNGKSVELLNKLDTPLRDGDEVAIIPPVGGG